MKFYCLSVAACVCAGWTMPSTSYSLINNVSVKLAQTRVCPQVIHCGIKDGRAREYPTRCAAEDAGATNIVPKSGRSCPEPK
jgi:hypothetical protein